MPRALRAVARATFADLDAAIDERPPVDDRIVHSLPIASIQPSRRNPRQAMDVGELKESLNARGLLQPTVVRRRGAGYELIAGHRRHEAASQLGWTTIEAKVLEKTPDEACILTLVENLQREDLSPKEEASALEVLVRERGWSTRQVGSAIKRSAMYVSRRLRVFDDEDLAPLVLKNGLAVSTAEELLRAPERAIRQRLAREAAAGNWTPADARQAVRDSTPGANPTRNESLQGAALVRRLDGLAAELDQVDPATLGAKEQRSVRRLMEKLRHLSDSSL